VTRARAVGLEPVDPAMESAIRERLNQVEAFLEKAVRSDTDFVTETASYLLAAGGKRFRPMLVLLSGYFGDPTDPRLVPGATAIELTHVATLYHDDVIDAADRRHGVPSVNARWGNNVAILTGDFLFARASEISSDLGADVTRLLARTIATVCDGQIREVESWGRLEQTQEAYLETIRRKTAALIATSCRLGAMLSDATPETIDQLDDFGMALGVAFQLSDDIMDVISTEEELHKEPGQDLKLGVYTLPVLYALQDGTPGRELAGILSAGPPSGERLDAALDLVRREEPLERARQDVQRSVERTRRLAEGLPRGTARESLLQITEYLAARCGADG
jgi:heptaprenyl diphosphate synthase